MTLRYSLAVRNAKLDAVENTIGASPHLKIFSGAEPDACASPDPAGLLCTVNLPPDWMNDADGGVKTLKGAWTDFAAANGVAASWRIYDTAGRCHIQGDVRDMAFDNTNLARGQQLTVTGFTLRDHNG